MVHQSRLLERKPTGDDTVALGGAVNGLAVRNTIDCSMNMNLKCKLKTDLFNLVHVS